MFSVQEKIDKSKSWKVIGYSNYLILWNVSFKVSEAGRLRVIKENKKNVHAFVIGDCKMFLPQLNGSMHKEEIVTYNPYKHSSFVVKETNETIHKASYCVMSVINFKPEVKIIR
jgi:hypothetical protein